MPPKRGANWLPQDDEQLAKSWLKISEDAVRSNGQKKDEFWRRVADDYNEYCTGIEREATSVMHRWSNTFLNLFFSTIDMFYYHRRWGHIQKATLKFSGLYHKLEANRPSGSVLTDLLPDAKKAFYEQEGKQFIYEQAWMVLRSSPKWRVMSQSRAGIAPDGPSSAPLP